MLLKVLFFVFVASNYANCARILGVFPMSGISRYILTSKLMRGLAEAGHDVTMISPYKLKDPPKNGKYTDVILEGFAEEAQRRHKQFNLFDMELMSPIEKWQTMTKIFFRDNNETFYHANVKQLLKSDKQFDVVIVEQFFNDALKVFAHIYNCPLILLSTVGPNPMVNPTVGNPQPPATVPHFMLQDVSKELSFFKRAKNLMIYIMTYIMTNYYSLPPHDEIMHQAFPDAPSIHDLYTNVSLVLLNSHTSIDTAVPMVPNMVEIGGYFIDPPQKLPQDLQEFMDSAKDGVVYFSMGSILKSKDIPEEKKKAILNVLGKLKQKVLWKFEEDLPGKPPNVMIRKWMPQQDILAHPNMKLFITHGGLLSITETVCYGVPILAIPVFADQPANAAKAVAGGYGLKIGYVDPNFNEETFGALVDELLNNPKYRENVQMRSKLFHDRPQKPMETAVYWVEYIIRHKGAPHLRVGGVRMPWYQYFMMDVFGVLVLGIILVLYIIKLVFKRLFLRRKDSDYEKIKTN